MTPAISNLAWAPEERLAAYEIMGNAGVASLEIAPGLFLFDSEDPFAPTRSEVKRAIAEIERAGLRLVSMQSLLFGMQGAELFGDAEARNRFEKGMGRAISLAGSLGIPNLVFGSPGQRRVPADLSHADALKQAADVFQQLAEQASRNGTVIAIEANPAAYGTNFLNTLFEVDAFVRQVSHPSVRLILDLGAMHINGDEEETRRRLPDLIATLNHVHVSEPHLVPAPEGPERIKPVLNALRAGGYEKCVSIEMKRGDRGVDEVIDRLAALKTALDAGTTR